MTTRDPTVLIFRIGSIGDTVVALPCFHRIALSFPRSRRVLITDAPVSRKAASVERVLERTSLIDETIYFPPPPRRLNDFLELRRHIRRSGASTLIYVADRQLIGTLRDVAFFRACGIGRIIGAPIARDLRRLRPDSSIGGTEREAERLARCLATLGPVDLSDPAMWDLHLQPDELRAAVQAVEPLHGRAFAAISVGGKERAKDWGHANWSELLQSMARDHGNLGLVFIGSADEFERSAAIAACWPGASLNLCGRLSPRQSAAVMQRAQLYLGHDCGPMHLAAAMGTPCVAMFGSFNIPGTWHPMGSQHRIIHDMRGIGAIEPPQVLAAIASVLAEGGGDTRQAAGAMSR